jgi:hypothetical protein
MRYLIIILFASLLMSLDADAAMKRYLVPCEDSALACNIGSTQTPKNLLCVVPDDSPGTDYDIEIITVLDEEVTDVKQWTKGAILADGEEIRCRLNPVKVTTRLAEEKAKEDAEKAKKDKETLDWADACSKDKGEVAVLICKERGF